MDEQAFQDLYKAFTSTGYNGSPADFTTLMSTNTEAFNDGYKKFTSTGYNGNEDDFAELIGVTNPMKKNLADAQPEDVTTAETYGGSLGEFSESEEVILPQEEDPGILAQIDQDNTVREKKENQERQIAKQEYAKDLKQWSEKALKQDQEFSWDAGAQPTTVTATEEVQTVASDPTVKVETGQEVEERHRVNRIEQRKTLSAGLQEYYKEIEADEENQLNIFEKKLKQIDLTNETEETIVPALNYLFQDYGFTFEEAIDSPNAIKITAPGVDRDGNKIERVIDFAEWSQYIDPSGFWSKRHQEMGGREDHETEIADFIKENRDISIRVDENKQKVVNEEQLNKVTKDFNIEANGYLQETKRLTQESEAIKQLIEESAGKYAEGSPEHKNILSRIRQHKKEVESLVSLEDNLKTKGKEYDVMVGEYAMMRAEGGGAWRQFKDQIKSGVGKLLGISLDVGLTAFGYTYGLDEEAMKEIKYGKDDKSVNPFSKLATKMARDTDEGSVEYMEDIVFKAVGRASTKEYLQDVQQADLFSAKGLLNVAFGVTEFLTAAPAGLPGIIALSAQYTSQEMRDNPLFDDIPEWERGAVALTIGTAVGVLEKIGFKNVLKSNPGIVNTIITKVLRRNPATMKTFSEYVEQDVKSLIKKGALRIGAGGAAEFETGGLQEAADIGLKEVYNSLIKGSDLFENPESLLEAGAQVLHGAAAESMGGKMMAAPKAFSYALGTNEISEIDNNTFQMLEEMSKDSKYLDLVTSKLGQQVVNQEITKADMDKILTDYNRMNGAMQKMPEGINTKNKKQLLSLFMEHQTLKNKMEKTDDVFNKKNKEELAKIEDRIDGVLEANEVEKSAQEVLETKAGETQVFYAENLEDVPEEFRGRANKVEDDTNEITFREKLFGLPIGKNKGAKIGEYYTYTLDGAEIKEVAKKKEAKEKIAQKEKEKARTPIATETYKSMEAVPSEIKDAAVVIRDKEGKVEVEYKDAEGNAKVETFDSKENIPQEIIDADAVITEMEDGSLSVDYKEDEVSIESPDITETFDSKEAIPQPIIDVVGEENIIEEDGKFTVTYKETDVLGATLEAKKKEAPVQEEIAEEFENIADDDTRTFSAESIEDIPEQYRDRAEKSSSKEVKTRKTFFGIPIGKERTTVTENFTFTLTGKEIKEQHPIDDDKLAALEKKKKKAATPQFMMKTEEEVLLAPNGKPSNLTPEQYKAVRTPEFKEWFGDWENDPENSSKVVDENGEPMVMYHGTSSDFNVFSKEKAGDSTSKAFKRNEWFWFSNNKVMAKSYGLKVVPTFINIRNPQQVSQTKGKDLQTQSLAKAFETAVKLKKDGIISKETADSRYDSQRIVVGGERIFIDHKGLTGSIAEELNAGTSAKELIDILEDALIYYNEELTTLEEYDKEDVRIINKVADALKKDGLNAVKLSEPLRATVVAAKNPNQIKLADGSNVTFDPESDDIRFQLETKKQTEGKKQELKEQALQQMEEVLPETAETVDTPEPGKVIPVTVKENTALAKKLKKVGLGFLIGKKINLVMADQLKVKLKDPSKPYNEETNPYVKKGGPFFALMDKLFGKIAWASMDKGAAGSIIAGAMKSDYSVVYNMNPTAIDSNSIMGETLLELLSDLNQEEQQNIFSQMKENVLASKAKDFKKIKLIFKKAKNLKEALKELQNLSVDERAVLVKKVVPSRDVNAGTAIGKSLQKNDITIEKLREINSEQFVADLPAGALTMILEVRDKNGNRVKDLYDDINTKYDNKEINPDTGKPYTKKDVDNEIKRIKDEATVMPEQQTKEGLPHHPNYDVYIRGGAVAMLNETTSFWNVIKDAASQIEKGIAGIIKARTGNAIDGLSKLETSIFDKLSEAKKKKYSAVDKKEIIKSILKNEAKKITLKDADGKEVKTGVIKDLKQALKQTSKVNIENAIDVALTPFAETRDKTSKEAKGNEMRRAMMSASAAKDVDTPLKTRYQMFVEKITKAFPSVEVLTSQKEFDALLKDLNAKALATKDQNIYGAVYEGKLYLNPSLENFNTPVHEFGHIWLNTAKAMKSELYNKGIDLIKKDSTYVDQVKANKDYDRVIKRMRESGVSEADINQYINEEALATAIGDKGESFATAAQQRNFKAWLTDLFNFVKKLTGISKLTANEVQNLNLDQFLQAVVVDIMSENPLFKKAEVSNFSNQLQLMSSDGTNFTMGQIIKIGRQEGFSDSAIKSYLKSQGYKAAKINESMAIKVDMFTQVPDMFNTVFEGRPEGLKFFNNIRNKINNWTRTRWGKGKSFSEFRAKAMEILMESDVFKAQSKTNQEKLIMGMDSFIGRKSAKDAAAPIQSIKNTVELLKKSDWENNIPKAQKSLRLATKPITATKMHKEKGTKIHKLINNLNKKNYQENIKKIDDLLTEIISDDKQITVKTNADLRKLRDKMTSYYKMLDYAKVKGETSKVIKEIKTVAQALTRNIGKENKDIIAKILSASKSMNTDNAGVAIPEIVEALNELYFKLKTQNQTTAQLARAVKSLKEQVQRRKEQAKNLAEIKTKLTEDIKKAIILLRDLDVKDYRYSAVQRILGKVNNANINNIAAVSAQVANIFSGITESHRKKKLVQIKKFITEHAKTKRDSSGKIKAKKAVGAFGQEFFAAFDKFLKLVEKNKETPLALYNAINEREALKSAFPDEKGYQDALKRMGESSDAEKVLIKKHIAEIDKILKEEDTSPYVSVVPELAIGLNSMTLGQLNNFFENDLKQKKIAFTKNLQEKLQIEKEARDKINETAIKQIAQDVPDMFSENQAEVDGVTEMYKVLKTDNEIGLEGKKIKGIKKAIKKIKENINTTTMFGGVQLLGTLSTICNNLDNLPNGRDFFTENIYKRLNRAFSRFTKGVQDQKAVFDQIAQSIADYKNENYTLISYGKVSSYEDLNYAKIKKLIFKTPDLKITVLTPKPTSPGQQKKIDKIKAEIKKLNKKNRKENKQEIQAKKDEITRMLEDLAASRKKHEVDFKADELMRIYALCKNEDQRAKLKKQGITDDVLEQIEINLGEDLTAFVDGIVEYLSNDYYNSVNGVYSDVNNVNLTKIPNYFPTKTESLNSALTAISLSDSDQFGAAFSAQFASSLKERTDRGSDVSFFDYKNENYTFTSELENHIGSSERFKAYAHDVKVINSIARNPVVATLLKRTGLAKLTNTIINNEINPISNSMNVLVRHMFSAFVGKQIGFKPIQFLKQSTSGILSFPKYTNNMTKNLPREAEIAANTVLYSYDQAKVYGQPWKWKAIIKEAMKVSPLFRDRVESFKGRGGYAAMETSINDTEENNRFSKWVRKFHRLGAIPTMAGDIMGVLGYWAVYKRDLANGMSPTKALEKFEDYNKTQQTKRGTELNIIQIKAKQSAIYSVLTTFNSTIFLMSSLVLESVNNMGKIIVEPKTKTGKIKAVRKAILSSDGLNFIFAMGLGNAAFAYMSNIAKVLYGDDDDYEEVLERTQDAMLGFNLLYSMPIIGVAAELAGQDEGSYLTPTEGVNPLYQFAKDYKKISKLEDDEFGSAFRELLFEYGTGINLDFLKGVMDYVNDENPEQRAYKVAGISNWFQPRN